MKNMNTAISKTTVSAILFLVVFASGYWMSRAGRPYNGLLFNAHKLIALGALIYLGVLANQVRQAAGFAPLQVAVVAIAAAAFIATIAAGGLVSIEKPLPAAQNLHKLLPYLALLSSAGALYILLFRES
jgi:hypothetical protein